MKKTFTNKMTNAVEPAAPTSVWGYKGCIMKGRRPIRETPEQNCLT